MSIQSSSSGAFAAPHRNSVAETSPASQAGVTLLTSPHISLEELLLPRSIAGVFDLSFDIYREQFRTLFTLAAVVLLPLQAILYLLFNAWLKPLNTFTDSHPDDISAGFGLITGGALTGYPQAGIPGLLTLAAFAVISAPLTLALTELYQGRTPHLTDCFRRAFRHIPRVLGGWITMACVLLGVLMLTLTLLTFLAFLVGIAVGLLHTVIPPAISVIIGVVFVATPYVTCMVALGMGFIFTTPLIVLEELPITLIPVRNWQLIKQPRVRRTLAAIVFLPIVFLIVQMLILFSLNGLLALVSLPPTLAFLMETGISVLLVTFLQPYLLIFSIVLYFDYRIQRDGLDITLIAGGLSPLPHINTAQEGGR